MRPRLNGAWGIAVLMVTAAFLSPLFGNTPADRHLGPASSAVMRAPDPEPAPNPDVPHRCQYVIQSWMRSQSNSDDQAAQDRLTEAINRLLPESDNTVRALTQKFMQFARELTGRTRKQDPLDHYDYVSVTETLDGSIGRMTVEISIKSFPFIPKHDLLLGPDMPLRIDGCPLPQPGDKGERFCRKREIEDIAEKIKAHDKEHDQGKYQNQKH